MSDKLITPKIYKRIDILENKEEYPPLKDERNFFQNKMMRFYKTIKDKDNPYNQTLFMSDNKGAIYIIEFTIPCKKIIPILFFYIPFILFFIICYKKMNMHTNPAFIFRDRF